MKNSLWRQLLDELDFYPVPSKHGCTFSLYNIVYMTFGLLTITYLSSLLYAAFLMPSFKKCKDLSHRLLYGGRMMRTLFGLSSPLLSLFVMGNTLFLEKNPIRGASCVADVALCGAAAFYLFDIVLVTIPSLILSPSTHLFGRFTLSTLRAIWLWFSAIYNVFKWWSLFLVFSDATFLFEELNYFIHVSDEWKGSFVDKIVSILKCAAFIMTNFIPILPLTGQVIQHWNSLLRLSPRFAVMMFVVLVPSHILYCSLKSLFLLRECFSVVSSWGLFKRLGKRRRKGKKQEPALSRGKKNQ